MPTNVGVVDLMLGFPSADAARHYDFMKRQLRDAESQHMQFPAEYMFKDVPDRLHDGADPVAVTLAEMDRHGVAIALVGLGGEVTLRALKEHPDFEQAWRWIPASTPCAPGRSPPRCGSARVASPKPCLARPDSAPRRSQPVQQLSL